MKKRIGWRSIIVLMLMFVFLAGCSSKASNGISHAEAEFSNVYKSNDTWLVYWYVCGSDLESEKGAASADLAELMQVKLPPNIKVLIETGGAKTWQTAGIKAQAVQRWLYDSEGLHLLQELPDADMGSRDTLTDFLRYGKDKFSADHRVFIFWNHGGGSAVGVAYDERYCHMLSLNDIRYAFASVEVPNVAQPPFELIGFDACLMGSIDMAHDLYGLARYMVASEEIEPGNGWDYEGWVSALVRNPAMGGAGLGKVICDTYMEDCRAYGIDAAATLSVADLSRFPQLRAAYEAVGAEALQRAADNPQRFFTSFSREAESAENYGGNTREQGYTNMVDLGSLVQHAKQILPKSADNLLARLDECVIYKVNGPYRRDSSGLSCYHSFNGDRENLRAYTAVDAAAQPFKCLYIYLLTGQMPSEATEYIGNSSAKPDSPQSSLGQSFSFMVEKLEDFPVEVDREGNAVVRLDQTATEILSAVHFQLFYYSPKDDIILYLGSDDNIDADWDNGEFKDNFQGKWSMLDGHLVYVEITQAGDGYNFYSVPVLLNGQACNLQVVYNFDEEKYQILGARKGIGTNGVADKNLIKLKAGDRITTLHYAMTMSGNEEEFTQVEVDTFTLGDNPNFEDGEMGDGKYGYCFEFVDPQNKSALSQLVTFMIENGEIYTTVE